MSLCPKCETTIPDTAFGLYTCSNCNTVVAIDFDGNASVVSEVAPSEVVPLSIVNPVPDYAQGEPYELKNDKPKEVSASFDDIAAFGNSEISQGASGNFLYDILISGVDSEDLRIAVREAFTDKRFGWDTNDIIKKMRGGSVKIEKVNAIKAAIIVSRLKGYPLEISWAQNGIFSMET